MWSTISIPQPQKNRLYCGFKRESCQGYTQTQAEMLCGCNCIPSECNTHKPEISRKIVVYQANKSNIPRHILHANCCDNKPPKGLWCFMQTHLLKHFCLVVFTTNEEFYLYNVYGYRPWHNFVCTSREPSCACLESRWKRQSATGIVQIRRSYNTGSSLVFIYTCSKTRLKELFRQIL